MSQERDNTVYWTRQKVVLSLVLSSRTNSTNGSCSGEEKQGMPGYAADMMSRPARFSFSDTPEMHVDVCVASCILSSFLSCRTFTVCCVSTTRHTFPQVRSKHNNNYNTKQYQRDDLSLRGISNITLHCLGFLPTTRKLSTVPTAHHSSTALRKHTPRSIPLYPPPLSPHHKSIVPSSHPAIQHLPIRLPPSSTKRLFCRPQPHPLARSASHGSRHSHRRFVPSLFLTYGESAAAHENLPPSPVQYSTFCPAGKIPHTRVSWR